MIIICIFYVILTIAVFVIILDVLNIFSEFGAFKDDFYLIRILADCTFA